MNILTCSEYPQYSPETAIIFGKSIQAHMETPIVYRGDTVKLNDNWRWMYWLWLWDQYFQHHPALLHLAKNYGCYRATPETYCRYPSSKEIYPGEDHDKDVQHLQYFSGRTGKQITTIQGSQRGPCDVASAIAYLVYCLKQGEKPSYPPFIQHIGQSIQQ